MSRYEIKDREHKDWRGQRFSSLERAQREMNHAHPRSRFYIYDRTTKQEIQ